MMSVLDTVGIHAPLIGVERPVEVRAVARWKEAPGPDIEHRRHFDPRHGPEVRERFRRVSGRNQLIGKVVSVRVEGLLAEVILSIGDGHVTSIITANAVRELQLKKGDTAAALIKSTDVMIFRD